MKDVNVLSSNGINVEGSLEILGDMEMYDETLNDFLDAIDENVSKIKTFKEQGDMPNYAILVHALKSDSKYLGFTKLAELAFQHEMESKASNVAFVNSHFDELMEETNHIVSVTKQYLG